MRRAPLTITFPDLCDLAAEFDVRVVEHRFGAKGWYSDSTKTISLRADLTPQQQVSTLAHELGHAYYRETPSDGYYSQRQERRADEYAARLLITSADYALSENIHGPCMEAIAWELGATPHIASTWKNLYTRGYIAN